MLRGRFFLFIAALSFTLGWAGQLCFADAAAQLQQAQNYQDKGYFSQAEQVYEQIVSQNPGTDSALQAQKQLVFIELQKQKKLTGTANPQGELDKLLTVFAGNTGLPQAIYDVAAEYQRLKKYQKAKQLYQLIIQQHTNSPQTAKAAVDVPKTDILALIKSGQANTAQKAIDSFIVQYSGNEYTAGALNDVAYFWRRFKRYDKAIELYQYVADTWPNNPDAMWAQMGVAKANVEALNFDAAAPAINKLLTNHPDHPDLPTAIHYLARRYRKEKQFDQARSLYQQIIQRYPGTSHSSDAQMEVAKMAILADIEAGNFDAASIAINKMTDDFSGHLNLARMLYEIPGAFERKGRYIEAKDVCQRIIDNCPGSFRADKAQLDLQRYDSVISIEAGRHDNVLSDVDSLVTRFTGNSYLPDVIARLANHYRQKAALLRSGGLTAEARDHLSKAIAIFDRILAQFADSPAAPGAACKTGDCYRRLGQYDKSNQYYQQFLDDYPSYYLAWQAQFHIGRNYEAMGKAGFVSKSAATMGADTAYRTLLEKYPDCKAAAYARDWLSR